MTNDLARDKVGLHLLQGVAVDAALASGWRDAKLVEEESMKVWVGAPVEVWEADAVEDDLGKLRVEALNLFVELVNDLGLAPLVDEDTTKAHFEGRALEGFGEGVGRGGGSVELGKEGVEDLCGDAAIEAVVDLLTLKGGEVCGESGGGVNDFH